MGEFFRGWKRKIGVLTLLIACVLMLGWVRSLSIEDAATLSGKTTHLILTSSQSKMVLTRHRDATGMTAASYQAGWTSNPITDVWASTPIEKERFWKRFGFNFEIGTVTTVGFYQQAQVEYCNLVVPYWSIVIPLIMLSAFLLLSNPGPSTPTKFIEPKATEGM